MKRNKQEYPKCESCGTEMHPRTVSIASADCYKCGKPIRIADLEEDENGDLSKEEIEFAKSKGAFIEKINFWGGESELNICQNCKSCIGPIYQGEYFFGEYPVEEFDMGLYCSKCKKYTKDSKENNKS